MILKINNLHKSFQQQSVLDGVELELEKGKIYALLGRNGAGKTTLFNCISNEIPKDDGEVLLNNQPLDEQDVGYVYTTPMLPDFLTGYEFLTFFIDIHSHKGLKRQDIDRYFELVGLVTDDQHKLIKDYSSGMRNKLQMLCILLIKPKVILLDEPLTAVDVVASLEMKKMLRDMKDESIMILSTHILQIAADLCDEIVILHKGKTEKLDQEIFHSETFEEKILEILQ